MGRSSELTDDRLQQIDAGLATNLLNSGLSHVEVARRLGISRYKLWCAIRPGYRERHRKRTILNARQRKGTIKEEKSKYGYLSRGELDDPFHIRPKIPEHVETERERMLSHNPSLSEVLCGDPPPWRSALWRKRNAGETRENP